MMKPLTLVAMLAVAPLAQPAFAQTEIPQQIVTQLRDQGFREIRVSRTFLGRTRIVAENSEYRREIVINPSTGLILRDYWIILSGDDENGGSGTIFNSSGGGSSSEDDEEDGRDEDDDDDDDGDRDDDDDDDESDDDNSGSGSDSDSSGSGSGGADDSDDD